MCSSYQSIGAVNTIVRRPSDGKLIGYNTDCEGAITAIENALEGIDIAPLMPCPQNVCILYLTLHLNITEQRYPNGKAFFASPLTGKQFVVVGAGGAGRAIAFGAKSRAARVIIFDIDFGKYSMMLICLNTANRLVPC